MRISGSGVILQVAKGSIVLLVRGSESGKWSFPKGASMYGETLQQTAEREMFEETGIHIHLTPDDHPIVFNKRTCKRSYFACDVTHVDPHSMRNLISMQVPLGIEYEIDGMCWMHKSQFAKVTRQMVNLDVWMWLRDQRHMTYIQPGHRPLIDENK